MSPLAHIPYCGAAPVPGAVAWNLDPLLVAILVAGAGAHLWAMRRDPPSRVAAVAAGWALLAALFISPLCNLSVALFSARVAQHMLLTLAAAPLIALGLPAVARRGPLTPACAFAAVLWFWHLPRPYDAAFASDAVYWAMDLSLLAAALGLWAALLRPGVRPAAVLAAALLTSLQMSLLGALLSFAPQPLFQVHLATTAPWGLTPLHDQQLGGALMWVPGGFLFAAVLAAVLYRVMLPRPPVLDPP